jgi:hypothetical protein
MPWEHKITHSHTAMQSRVVARAALISLPVLLIPQGVLYLFLLTNLPIRSTTARVTIEGEMMFG